MIVTVTPRIFQSVETLLVLSLFTACKAGKHLILLHSEAEAVFKAWAKDREPSIRQELEQLVRQDKARLPKSSSKCRITVEHQATSDWEKAQLTIEDAIPFLFTPLSLLVENRHSDGDFLMAFFEKRNRETLRQLLLSGRVRFENGGGLPVMLSTLASLRNQPKDFELDELAKAAPAGLRRLQTCTYYTANLEAQHWRERLRFWVLFDRDRDPESMHQPPAPSFTSEAVRALCLSMKHPWPLPHHQHVRRAIENYLPLKVLDTWAEQKKDRRADLERLKLRPDRHFTDLKAELNDTWLSDLFSKCDKKHLEQEITSDPQVRQFRERLFNSILENL